MGMNALGEIAELCRHFQPEAGLITNIGDAHLGKLGGKRGIYQAKKELFDHLGKLGARGRGVALNVDDELIQEAYRSAFPQAGKVVTYSAAGKPADVQVVNHQIDPSTGWLSLSLNVLGHTVNEKFAIYGLHHTQNIAAAVAAAWLLGVSIEEMRPRFASIRPATHRGEIHALPQGRVLIDESYNSNPTALDSSLASLNKLDPRRRRVLILGEMREMGEFSEKVHREAGEGIVRRQKELGYPLLLVGVGAEILPLVKVVEASLPEVSVHHLGHQKEVLPMLHPLLRPEDILLVKGSHGVRLDIVVDELRNEASGHQK
jgi:UDP-N-acetylmuramoyl-tripeptide--D-alanyl-D-alanine ligase